MSEPRELTPEEFARDATAIRLYMECAWAGRSNLDRVLAHDKAQRDHIAALTAERDLARRQHVDAEFLASERLGERVLVEEELRDCIAERDALAARLEKLVVEWRVEQDRIDNHQGGFTSRTHGDCADELAAALEPPEEARHD